MENINFWANIITAVVTGLVAVIPVVIKLIDTVQKAAKEKNWKAVVQLVLKLMTEAEQAYTNGADKKTYVMSSIKAMESALQYDIDEDAIGSLVDSIVAATKKINADK